MLVTKPGLPEPFQVTCRTDKGTSCTKGCHPVQSEYPDGAELEAVGLGPDGKPQGDILYYTGSGWSNTKPEPKPKPAPKPPVKKSYAPKPESEPKEEKPEIKLDSKSDLELGPKLDLGDEKE